YVKTVNSIWALTATLSSSLPVINTAGTIIMNPSPSSISPNDIFVGTEKSPRFVLDSLSHMAATIGAQSKMNSGFRDWNQDVGTSHPKIVRSIKCSVYSVNEAPACSKPTQNIITNAAKIKMTVVLCFSYFVNGFALLAFDEIAFSRAGFL